MTNIKLLQAEKALRTARTRLYRQYSPENQQAVLDVLAEIGRIQQAMREELSIWVQNQSGR